MENKKISMYEFSGLSSGLRAIMSDYFFEGLAIKRDYEQNNGILFTIALMDRERDCFSRKHLLPLAIFCQEHNLNLVIKSNSILNITIL